MSAEIRLARQYRRPEPRYLLAALKAAVRAYVFCDRGSDSNAATSDFAIYRFGPNRKRAFTIVR